MSDSSKRFDNITANFVTSEVHRSSPTISRLLELTDKLSIESVCDIGCGAGYLGLSFVGKASRFVAVDPAPNMLEAAKELGRQKRVDIETYRSPAEKLPLASNQFDGTMSRLAPHHFEDIQASVCEMARVTRFGGFVAVIDLEGNDVPQYDELNHRLELLHDPTHVRSYTANAWRRFYENAGLRLTNLEGGLSERPMGLPVVRWCEIASSGTDAELQINQILNSADQEAKSALGIMEIDGQFLMPIRTVLIVGHKVE
jgi:ubiquinone/menaquinone biosynthesis C-methylase UbiE